MPCASLGGAHGLVELFLDLDYILELEWICGENGHTLRIIPGDQNHPKAVSWFQISYSKLHFSLLCFKLQDRSWCIPPSVTTKLVDHRSVPTRRQPERITSYQLVQGHLKTWLADRMEADERGAVAAYFFYSNGKNQSRKTANDKMDSSGTETKRTALYCDQTDTCNR
jgi:hypothetical protein